MTQQLAAQYRGSALLVAARLEELQSRLPAEQNSVQRHALEKRIACLQEEKLNLLSTARYLEEYYEEISAEAAPRSAG